MLKRYFHKRERYYAMLTDNRIVRPFEWGVEHVLTAQSTEDPAAAFRELSADWIERSDEYFELRSVDFTRERSGEHDVITWHSAVRTPDDNNNTAIARYFPYAGNDRSAVLILPHWNAQAGSYFDLARLLNKVGISVLRLTMPYHEERMPPGLERADHLVAPNVGRTLQSVRQAVLDTRAAIKWLKAEGFERVGIVGTSIGSCTAFLAFVHDMTIDVGVFNHVSGYFADVVWHGLSTYHVREALEKEVSLDELREYWLPISPMTYMSKLASQPRRPQHYIYTKYDLTFPYDLSLETMKKLRSLEIPHVESALPCGHYTLGEKPWNYIDGYKIISFMRKHLR